RADPEHETSAARPKAPLDMVPQLSCPLFGVFGEEDQNPPVALEAEIKKRAAAAGKDVTTKIYKDAGHAFLADYRPSYKEAAATELWGDVTAFFGKHLK
ncbi:MAG TPA: dienelactone hydrolase family protein, partial [Stellaceae bacterium]|nr:dienelactone hydrolase family protein [Stellaceae bacterium]